MGKQVKAEWFRMRNSGYNFYYFGIILIFMSLYPFSNNWGNINQPLPVSVRAFSQQGIALFFLVAILVVVLFGNRYQNRTYYYEIMSGVNIHIIIVSKIITYSIYVFLMFVIPNVILYTVITIRNGLGECNSPGTILFLFCIIALRFVVEAVLLTMIVRRVFSTCVILFAVCMGSRGLLLIAGSLIEASNEVSLKLLDWSVYSQIAKLYQPEYSVSFMIAVVGSFAIEVALLYVLTLVSYRRKKFR